MLEKLRQIENRYSELESKEAAEAYQTHPAHLEAKKTVHGYAVGRAACDFEV